MKQVRAAVVQSVLASQMNEEWKEAAIQLNWRTRATIALILMRAFRATLDQQGFVVLTDVMKDSYLEAHRIFSSRDQFESKSKELWEWVEKRVPTPSQLHRKRLTPEQNHLFYGICNLNEGKKDTLMFDREITRISATTAATNEYL